jgi:hypothetical protein
MKFQALMLSSLGMLTLACVLAFDVERCIIFLAILIAQPLLPCCEL